MARPVQRAGAVDLPIGRKALGWLASVSAWRHYVCSAAAEPALAHLYREHEAAPLAADDAVRAVWAALGEVGELDAFERWRGEHGSWAGHWPTREYEERQRRVPAI